MSAKGCAERGTLGPRCGLGAPVDVMGYHDARDIPNYWSYARHFVLQDRMFEPNYGWSLPSHLFEVSAWSARCSDPNDASSCRNDLSDPPNGPAATRKRYPDGPLYGWTDLTYLMYHFGVNAGQLSLNRFVEITSTTPARIFGMYPRKGEIAPGCDADLVLWDPKALYTISAATHHMRVDYSMFEGYDVTGNARTVLSRGEVIVDGGQFLGKPGRGNYLKRTARGGAWK